MPRRLIDLCWLEPGMFSICVEWGSRCAFRAEFRRWSSAYWTYFSPRVQIRGFIDCIGRYSLFNVQITLDLDSTFFPFLEPAVLFFFGVSNPASVQLYMENPTFSYFVLEQWIRSQIGTGSTFDNLVFLDIFMYILSLSYYRWIQLSLGEIFMNFEAFRSLKEAICDKESYPVLVCFFVFSRGYWNRGIFSLMAIIFSVKPL